MVYRYFPFLFCFVVLASPALAQIKPLEYEPPQIVVKGAVETLFDQGLVRKGDQVADYWRNFDGNQVRIKKLKLKGKSGEQVFDVIIVVQREGELREQGDFSAGWEGAHMGFVPNLFRWTRQFLIPHYEKYGGEATVTRLKQERDFYNGVSSMVIVTKENDISNVVGTLRVVRRGNLKENEMFDVEAQTGQRLPEVGIEIREVDGEPVAFGDWAEIKTYTQSDILKEEGIDLQPILMSVLHQYKLYEFGQRFTTLNGKAIPWAATHLAVEAAEKQARLYQRPKFGFELLHELDAGLFLLGAKVDDYLKLTSRVAEGDDPYLRNFLDSPPLSGWNYLPVLSPEQFDFVYAQAGESNKSSFPRFHLSNGDQVPFYHHPDFPVESYEQAVADTIQAFHPFDPLRRLGTSEERFIDFRRKPYRENHKSFPSNISFEHHAGEAEHYRGHPLSLQWMSNWSLQYFWHIFDKNSRRKLIQSLNDFYASLIKRGFADPRLDAEAPARNIDERLRLVLIDPTAHISDIQQAVRRLLPARRNRPELDVLFFNALSQLEDLNLRLERRLFQHRTSIKLMDRLGIDPEKFIADLEQQIIESFEELPPRDKELNETYEQWLQKRAAELVLTGREESLRMKALKPHLDRHPELAFCFNSLKSLAGSQHTNGL